MGGGEHSQPMRKYIHILSVIAVKFAGLKHNNLNYVIEICKLIYGVSQPYILSIFQCLKAYASLSYP